MFDFLVDLVVELIVALVSSATQRRKDHFLTQNLPERATVVSDEDGSGKNGEPCMEEKNSNLPEKTK
jgi:hypothetical protein